MPLVTCAQVLAVLARRRKITLEDVICSHKILLERDDLLDLLKDGVKVLYHMQRLGESIIVPAGCVPRPRPVLVLVLGGIANSPRPPAAATML